MNRFCAVTFSTSLPRHVLHYINIVMQSKIIRPWQSHNKKNADIYMHANVLTRIQLETYAHLCVRILRNVEVPALENHFNMNSVALAS